MNITYVYACLFYLFGLIELEAGYRLGLNLFLFLTCLD